MFVETDLKLQFSNFFFDLIKNSAHISNNALSSLVDVPLAKKLSRIYNNAFKLTSNAIKGLNESV